MTRRMDIKARLTELTRQPGWLPNPWAVAHEAAESLTDSASELLDVMLSGSESLRDAAYRCLIFVRLPDSVVARLTSVFTWSNDVDQVASCLRLLAYGQHTDALVKIFVERGLGLGGEAGRAAISAIPFVNDDEDSLQQWLLAIFDAGDESDCQETISTAHCWSDEFAITLLERGCRSDTPAVVSQALSEMCDEDLDRDWAVAMIREVLERWPEQENVLLSCVCTIKDRELAEFAEFIERMLCHPSGRIALEAGEALGFIARDRVQPILREKPAGLHDSARIALESWAHDIQEGRV